MSLGGSVVRIDPDTGAAWPTNPAAGDPDANRSRIVAYGFRNLHRLDIDQDNAGGVADVGWGRYEELDLFDPSAGTVPNFGWPCHEGPAVQPVVADAGFEMCESLAPADVELPAFAYSHQDPLRRVLLGRNVDHGIASVRSGTYPAPFDDGMFMGDYSRQCVFFLPRTPTGYDFENRLSIVRTSLR
ncbi:MAG: PQQ-dependent sugar dehydrogenase [Microthrixaceae bacterium]